MSTSVISKLRLTIILSLVVFMLSAAPSRKAGAGQKEARVTEVFLKADDARQGGQCPVTVRFTGYITTDGPGPVTYTFTRSDGATGPVQTLDFKAAGTQSVSTTWTLGDATTLPSYEGWQAVKVLSPNEVESSRETGGFVLKCGATGAAEKAKGGLENILGGVAAKTGKQLQVLIPPVPQPSPPAGGASRTQTQVPGGQYNRLPPITNQPAGGYDNSIDDNGNP